MKLPNFEFVENEHFFHKFGNDLRIVVELFYVSRHAPFPFEFTAPALK